MGVVQSAGYWIRWSRALAELTWVLGLVAAPVPKAPALRAVPVPARSGPGRIRARWAREWALSAILWCVSIGALLLLWYVGTRYRLDFYIRFQNIPTPHEVLLKVVEVNQSTKFLTNIARRTGSAALFARQAKQQGNTFWVSQDVLRDVEEMINE